MTPTLSADDDTAPVPPAPTDKTTEDAPPKTPTPKRPTRKRPSRARKRTDSAPRAARPPKIAKKVHDNAQTAATLILTWGLATNNPAIAADANVIAEHAEELGNAVDAVAKEHPAIKAALEKAFVAGAWSQLAAVSMAIAIPIAKNHGVLPTLPRVTLEQDQPPQDQPPFDMFGVPATSNSRPVS